jgi:uncharacterized peroxidase-related enzyme
VESHGEDLRTVTRDDELVEQVKKDYRQAKLNKRQRALCEFAAKLTVTPWKMGRNDVQKLRKTGLTDTDVLDAVEVISFFNYINRVADALRVDPEPWMRKKRS